MKIHGHSVEVDAQIESLEFLSAHADYLELIQWLGKIPVAPKRCFITHGEPDSAAALQKALQDDPGWVTWSNCRQSLQETIRPAQPAIHS
ncbi:MAG: hypothetical protein O7F73_03090 [Gammaproteobacteria bacterium]|nr:hypothetical protein [Gammaproteobacteria bacterium]